MKPHHILVYLGMLVGVLVMALISGQLSDESQRVRFDTWAIPTALVAVVVVWYFVSRRRVGSARQTDAARPVVALENPAPTPPPALSIRPVFAIVSIAGGLLILSWVCLLHFGAVGDEGRQAIALLLIRVVTTVITTCTALLLSRFASSVPPKKSWVLQLGAVSQIVFAFCGLIILPFVALTMWNDYVDFKAHSLRPGFLLLLLPAAAVVFCMTRGGGATR
jgi:hypothetical protein